MGALAMPANRAESDDSASTLDALLVPLGADWYAFDVRAVREVVVEPRVTGLPTVAAVVVGVFNLRGDIVPLFDTAALLGLGVRPSCPFAVVVETALGLAGLVAGGVPEAVSLGAPTGPSDLDGTAGSYLVGTRVVTLLDVDVLLAPARVGSGMS